MPRNVAYLSPNTNQASDRYYAEQQQRAFYSQSASNANDAANNYAYSYYGAPYASGYSAQYSSNADASPAAAPNQPSYAYETSLMPIMHMARLIRARRLMLLMQRLLMRHLMPDSTSTHIIRKRRISHNIRRNIRKRINHNIKPNIHSISLNMDMRPQLRHTIIMRTMHRIMQLLMPQLLMRLRLMLPLTLDNISIRIIRSSSTSSNTGMLLMRHMRLRRIIMLHISRKRSMRPIHHP